MTKPKKFSAQDATHYRLRMVSLNWYLYLFKNKKSLGALGPWAYDEAQAEADKLVAAGLKDWDKEPA